MQAINMALVKKYADGRMVLFCSYRVENYNFGWQRIIDYMKSRFKGNRLNWANHGVFFLVTKWDSGGGAVTKFKDGIPLKLDHRIYGEHLEYIDTIKGILHIGELEVNRLIDGQGEPLGEFVPTDS